MPSKNGPEQKQDVTEKTNTFSFWWFSALLLLHHTSSLTSPRSISPPTQIWNFLKFWAIFLSAPCQSSPTLLRRLSPTIEASNHCFTESTAWFSSRFFPKNRKTTAEQIQWWIRDHKCWRVIPALDTLGADFFPRMGQQQIQGHRGTDPDPDTDIRQNIGCKFTDWRLFVAYSSDTCC